MRTKIKTKSFLCFSLALLMLCQSCRVYDAGSLSLEEAVESKSFVKIRQHNGKPLKFKHVVEEEGKFYGITYKRGIAIKQELEVDNVAKIKRKNSTWSTIASITGGVSVGLMTIVAVALGNFSYGGADWTWSW